MKSLKGFTIVELLVVIAVITILIVVVVIGLTQYVVRARNSAIKENLWSMRGNAVVFRDTHGTLSGFIEVNQYKNPRDFILEINPEAKIIYALRRTRFCAKATLLGGYGDWCVDTWGYSGPPDPGGCNPDAIPPVYTCLAELTDPGEDDGGGGGGELPCCEDPNTPPDVVCVPCYVFE